MCFDTYNANKRKDLIWHEFTKIRVPNIWTKFVRIKENRL